VREWRGTRYSKLLVAGLFGFALLVVALGVSVWHSLPARSAAPSNVGYGIGKFSIAFLNEYWLQFELTSVLLVAAVVAALAVIKVSKRAHHG
jgi:NADH-quinone oxidoreductase subunit J